MKHYRVVFRGVEYVFPAGVPVEDPEDLASRLLGNPRLSGLFVEVQG